MMGRPGPVVGGCKAWVAWRLIALVAWGRILAHAVRR